MKPVYTNLSNTTGAHIAGICTLQVAPREWLNADPIIDFNTGKVLAAVTLKTGKAWLTLDLLQDSYDYNEKPKSSKSGMFYEISLSGTLNNFPAEVQQVLESIRYNEVVAIVKDRNKRTKLVGNTAFAMLLTYTNKNTNNQGGTQSITIDMVMESEAPAPFYEV